MNSSKAPPPSHTPWLRRIYMVDLSFQLKYSLLFGLLGGLTAATGGMATWSASAHMSYALLTLVSVLSAAVIGLAALLLTHRIAGPAYVMSRDLSTLASGHFPDNRGIRGSDELSELHALFRRSVEFLRTRELEEAMKIRRAISELSVGSQSALTRQCLSELEAMCEQKRAMTERLGAQFSPEQAPAPRQ